MTDSNAHPSDASRSPDAIPTIDFSPYRRGGIAAQEAIAAAIGHAAEVYGFVLIVGHGIDPSVLRGAFEAGHDFFVLPEADKRRWQGGRSNYGYQPMYDNLRDDGKPSAQEGYTMRHPEAPGDPALADIPFYAPTPWPELPAFRQRLEALYASMFGLGRDILGAMASHLGAPPDFFEHALVDTYSHMRINHYPPHEHVSHVADEGVFAHQDESLLTLLLQDGNSGLQVMGRDGRWIEVEPNPDAIVVNVGKMLRHWTGGRYNAALHKVINASGRDRYSIPLFMHPSFRTIVDPARLDARSASPEYPPIVAGEKVYASFAATRKSWREEDARAGQAELAE